MFIFLGGDAVLSFVAGFAFLAAAATLAAADTMASDFPATPKYRVPPDFPASCMAAASEQRVERVIVVYAVTDEGRTEGARVRETTNACFNEAAIAAVRSWEFTPRKVDGRPVAQEDVETTISFTLKTATKMFDYDARPLVRIPAQYPQKCMRKAASLETVLVAFDVTVEGTTENIRALDASNPCLVPSAEASVARWKYTPMIIDGAPAPRKGVETLFTYKLSGGPEGVPADRVRKPVWNALGRVNKLMGPKGDPDKALAELASIEAKYGADFSRTEQAAFHQLRGGARLDKKDYAGALDDLRVAQSLGATIEDREKLGQLIAELERIVAAQGGAEPAPPAADESDDG